MGKKFQDNCKKQAKILTCKFKHKIFAKNKNDISPLKARDAQKSECKKGCYIISTVTKFDSD